MEEVSEVVDSKQQYLREMSWCHEVEEGKWLGKPVHPGGATSSIFEKIIKVENSLN